MKKLLKWTLIVVPVVLIIVIVVVLLSLDGIVKRTVESQATASTNLNTRLASANLSLLGGKVNLSGLAIGSPKGFQAPEMFTMKSLNIGVNYSQLRQDPIHVSEIIVDAPSLVIEQQGTSVNVKAAMDQMPKSEPSNMRLIIDTLQVNNTQVTIKTNLPMVPPEMKLVLPSITMKNIGNADGAQNGAAIKDVLKQVLAVMMEKAQQSKDLPGDLGKWLNPDTLQQQVQGEVNKQLKNATDQAKEQAQKQLDQGLQGLFKKK